MTQVVNRKGLSNTLQLGQSVSVKELRKILGKKFDVMNDDQISNMSEIVKFIATEFVEKDLVR